MLHLRHKAEIQLLISPSVAIYDGSGTSQHASGDLSDADGPDRKEHGERRGGVWRLLRYIRKRMVIEEGEEDEGSDLEGATDGEEMGDVSDQDGRADEGILGMMEDDMYL
jgi:hypothetical protein